MRDVLSGISWQRLDNAGVRRKLREFNELRNRIVHGKAEIVHKKSVIFYMGAWRNFAKRFDRRVGKRIEGATGSPMVKVLPNQALQPDERVGRSAPSRVRR